VTPSQSVVQISQKLFVIVEDVVKAGTTGHVDVTLENQEDEAKDHDWDADWQARAYAEPVPLAWRFIVVSMTDEWL
jgi:hypothetical protein